MTVKREGYIKRKCLTCGKEFDAVIRKARYCSDACRQLAYRNRRDINRKKKSSVTIYP